MKSKNSFQVGDAVFYPSAGVGVIEAVEDVFLTGERERCFVVRVQESGATIKIPVRTVTATGIRAVIGERKVKDLYKVLGANAPRRPTTGNMVDRCRDLERKVNKGSSMELGEVVRDLLRWKNERGLSFEESRLLQLATNHLAREVAVAQGITPEDAASEIRARVGVA